MKMLTASTLALTLAGTAAFAEAHMTDYSKVDSAAMNEMRGNLIRTRDITGGEIYTTGEADGDWNVGNQYDAIDSGWNEIGEIEDIVLLIVSEN
jgi:hypothetical protein